MHRFLLALLGCCLASALSAQTITLISAVQGDGAESPLAGRTVTISGIVVGDFQGGDGTGLGGFFVQEEDADADDDAATSEGIWVNEVNFTTEVSAGDQVSVTGTVSETDDLTQLRVTPSAGIIAILSGDNELPAPTDLFLPYADPDDLEAYEGMRVRLADEVTVTNNFTLGRFGEYEVSADGRQAQFTECNAPDPDRLATYTDQLARSRFIVDDGRGGQNNATVPLPDGELLSATNTLRAGTRINGLTGILDERFDGYRLQYLGNEGLTENERPTTAPAVGGNLTVASMNVLNYFTTLDDRGADSAREFERQEAKIVAAICELDADIIGLIEVENNGFQPNDALPTLVAAIEASCGTDYDWVVNPSTGSDAIFVALIYKPETVEQSGTAASLTTPGSVFRSNRVPLAQTFRIVADDSPSKGQEVTVVVNHWKSKGGGGCGSGDDDRGGAGNCDGTRQDAARAIRDWLTTDPTGTGETDQLVIGDLNAYSAERPLGIFTDAGFVNTVRAAAPAGSFPCGSVPSFVFRGQWGSLDHALASASLAPKVTGATPWNVNAAEPIALDYNTEFAPDSYYAGNFYRFSDHDPVVVGLDLGEATDGGTNSVAIRQSTDGTVTIFGGGAGAKFRLTSQEGRTLRRGRLTTEISEVDTRGLPTGLYFLSVRDRERRWQTFRIIVTR